MYYYGSRRCRNLYCSKCTVQTSPVLLLNIPEPVRICDRCSSELPNENSYVSKYRNLLYTGDSFKKTINMGMGSKMVDLRLLPDNRTLVCVVVGCVY